MVLDAPYTPPSGLLGQLPTAGAIDTYAAGRKKQDARFTISGYGLSDQDPVPGLVPRAADGDVVPRQQRGADHRRTT